MTIGILLGGLLLWAGLALVIHAGITRMQSRRKIQYYLYYDLAAVAEEAERWLRSQDEQPES
jgi:hypothetical protein